MNHWLHRLALTLAVITCGPAAQAQTAPLKVLTVARTTPFESLDPQRQFSLSSNDIVVMTYSTLLRFNYLQRPYKLEPDLLERLPELSADKLSYTLTLKKGLRFHDSPAFPGGKGREVTADDVIYSLRRYADARVNTKSWFAMEGAVAGLDAWRAATAKAPATPTNPDDLMAVPVEGLQKLDNLRLRIKLTKPNPLFLYTLAMSPTAVVAPEAVRHFGDRLSVNPVGTGAFMLNNADRKGVLHLVKNPNYHGVYPSTGGPGDAEWGLLKDAGRKLPFLDAVDMPLIEEAQPAMLRFLNGELDRQALDRANFTKMARMEANGDLRLNDEYARRFDLHATPSLSVFYFMINMKDPLLGANKKLRQALAHLVDTASEIKVLLNGRGKFISSLVPLDLPGSERDTGATRRSFDVETAKRLLAEAGFPGGKGLPAFTMTFQNIDSDTRNRFDLYKARSATAGVQLKALFLDYPSFVKVTEASNFQIADFAWNADYPDAEDFYQLLYSKNVAPGPNLGSWVNAAFDRGYEATRHMADGPERLAHFRVMNALVLEEAPVLFNYSPVRVSVTQKWLRNFKRNLLQPEFEFLDIDLARKSAKP
jgi:ABC-type transport system substrate-binding protein